MSYITGGPTGQNVNVTPDDDDPVRGLNKPEDAVFDFVRVDGAGSLVIIQPDGVELTVANALAGEFFPYRGTHIKDTGTSATGIIASFPDASYGKTKN